MKIIIQSSRSHIIDIASSDLSVSSLKNQLESIISIPQSLQFMTFQGTPLRDDNLISDYNIQTGSQIFVHGRIVGGSKLAKLKNLKKKIFDDFEELAKFEKSKVTNVADAIRSVTKASELLPKEYEETGMDKF